MIITFVSLYNYIPKETLPLRKGVGTIFLNHLLRNLNLLLEIDGGVLIQRGLFRSTIKASIVDIFFS